MTTQPTTCIAISVSLADHWIGGEGINVGTTMDTTGTTATTTARTLSGRADSDELERDGRDIAGIPHRDRDGDGRR